MNVSLMFVFSGNFQFETGLLSYFFYQTVCERSASSERGEAKAC